MLSPSVPDVAGRQDGLFDRSQAVAAGWSQHRIRTLLRLGLWVTVLGDVMASSRQPLTLRQRAWAAQRTTGGVVSHATAAELWRLPVTRDGRLHVTVGRPTHPRVDGVRLHRLRLPGRACCDLDGLRVTDRTRTIVDCLASMPLSAAAGLLDQALREGWITLDSLEQATAAAWGRHGAPQLRDLLRDARSGSRSEAERVLHRLLRSAGIGGWSANVELKAGGVTAVVDVWFPRQRLVIEVDGRAFHSTPDRFQRDRTRQNALVLVGCTVLRFTWADLVEAPERVLREIRAALSRTP